MKKAAVVGVAFLVGMVAFQARAAVPELVNFQARLSDANGNAVADADYQVVFTIYDAATEGTALWTETQTVTVAEGVFSVALGSVTTLGLAFDAQYWLALDVEGDGEMTPRFELASAPYALRAKEAEAVDWAGVANVPADIADGDDDTIYTDGTGILVSGDTISADTGTAAGQVASGDHNHDAAYVNDATREINTASDFGFAALTHVVNLDADTVDGQHAADLLDKTTYDPDDDGKVASAVAADTAVNADTVDGSHAADLAPAGTMSMFAGSTAPAGYLLCDGSLVSRTTYADLFAVIDTTYDAGDGSTTFGLPDMRGRAPVGLDAAQPQFNALNVTGGEISHTLTAAEMASHSHGGTTASVANHNHSGTTASVGNHNHSVTLSGALRYGWTTDPSGANIPFALGLIAGLHADGAYDEMRLRNGAILYQQPPDWDFIPFESALNNTSGSTGTHSHTFTTGSTGTHGHTYTTSSTGGSTAHNVLQPYAVVNYIIKY